MKHWRIEHFHQVFSKSEQGTCLVFPGFHILNLGQAWVLESIYHKTYILFGRRCLTCLYIICYFTLFWATAYQARYGLPFVVSELELLTVYQLRDIRWNDKGLSQAFLNNCYWSKHKQMVEVQHTKWQVATSTNFLWTHLIFEMNPCVIFICIHSHDQLLKDEVNCQSCNLNI